MWNAYRYTFIDEETFIDGLVWNAYTFIDEETYMLGPGKWVRISKIRDCWYSVHIGLAHIRSYISSFLNNENRKHIIVFWEIGSNATLSPHSCDYYNQKRHRTTHFCGTPYLHRFLTPPPARIAPLREQNRGLCIATLHTVASKITKLLLGFRQILEFYFEKISPQWRIPSTKPDKRNAPSKGILPPPKCTLGCESASKKLTTSTKSVLLLLSVGPSIVAVQRHSLQCGKMIHRREKR